MDERLKFVARLLDGEKIAVLCRAFEISRKTGYKIWNRYQHCGLKDLTDSLSTPLPAGQPAAVPDQAAHHPAQA